MSSVKCQVVNNFKLINYFLFAYTGAIKQTRFPNMGYWIIEKLYTLWFVLGFFFPLFWNAFFGFPLLVARSLPNLRRLIVYIIVIGILLYDWNQEVYKIPSEQYEDFESLSLAIAEMFTFLLDVAVILGIVIRATQLYKRYKRIKFIR